MNYEPSEICNSASRLAICCCVKDIATPMMRMPRVFVAVWVLCAPKH